MSLYYNNKISQELIYMLVDDTINLNNKVDYLRINNYEYTVFRDEVRIYFRIGTSLAVLIYFINSKDNSPLQLHLNFSSIDLVYTGGGYDLRNIDRDLYNNPVSVSWFSDYTDGVSIEESYPILAESILDSPDFHESYRSEGLRNLIKDFAKVCTKLIIQSK